MEANATVFVENIEELELEENIQLHVKMFVVKGLTFKGYKSRMGEPMVLTFKQQLFIA